MRMIDFTEEQRDRYGYFICKTICDDGYEKGYGDGACLLDHVRHTLRRQISKDLGDGTGGIIWWIRYMTAVDYLIFDLCAGGYLRLGEDNDGNRALFIKASPYWAYFRTPSDVLLEQLEAYDAAKEREQVTS
jgi:hypothetical protein